MHGTISAKERAAAQALGTAPPATQAPAGGTRPVVGRSVRPDDDPRRKAYIEG